MTSRGIDHTSRRPLQSPYSQEKHCSPAENEEEWQWKAPVVIRLFIPCST